jgi:hypothetical protein
MADVEAQLAGSGPVEEFNPDRESRARVPARDNPRKVLCADCLARALDLHPASAVEPILAALEERQPPFADQDWAPPVGRRGLSLTWVGSAGAISISLSFTDLVPGADIVVVRDPLIHCAQQIASPSPRSPAGTIPAKCSIVIFFLFIQSQHAEGARPVNRRKTRRRDEGQHRAHSFDSSTC